MTVTPEEAKAWIAIISPPQHAIPEACALLPIVFSGSDSDEAVEAAETLWVSFDDPSRLRYCFHVWLAVSSGRVHRRVWSRILSFTWTRGKAGSLLTAGRIGYGNIEAMFSAALPEHLMEPDELAAFNGLPDEITAYRGTSGISKGRARYGMSWTLDRAYGAWFANWHAGPERPPLCIEAAVRKADVLAFFATESEIVVRSGRVRRLREIPIRQASLSFRDRHQLLIDGTVDPDEIAAELIGG